MSDEIIWAVKNGDLEKLKKLTFDANLAINGTPLLVTAADYGQEKVIEYLIKGGASVDTASTHGITPVLAAIWENHVEAVQILVNNGAKINGVCPDGTSYKDAATSDKVKELLK